MATIKTFAINVNRILFPMTESRYHIGTMKGIEVILDLFGEAEKNNQKPHACLIYRADATDKAQKIRPLDDWEKKFRFYKFGTLVDLSEFRLDPDTGELTVKTEALTACEIKNISALSGVDPIATGLFDCEIEIVPLAPPLFSGDESGKIYEWELEIFRNSTITLGGYLEQMKRINPAVLGNNPLRSFLAGVDLLDVDSVKKVIKALYKFLDLYFTDSRERQLVFELSPRQKAIAANKVIGGMIGEAQDYLNRTNHDPDQALLGAPPDCQNGHNGHSEIQELREKFEQKKQNLPEEIQKIIIRYLKMVGDRQDSEAKKYIEYINYILDYPFGVFAKERDDFNETAEILNKSHYKLDGVKEKILEFLAARKLNPKMKGSILCLVGPAGVGKTSIGKSIAEALGRPFCRISIGGVKDESDIRGHSFTYVGSKPGRISEQIKRCGVGNPVFMIDEIDKTDQLSAHSNIEAALLEVLDAEQNNRFEDHYLGVPIDLSQVLFVATGNVLEDISAPLRDRMRVIRIPGYTIPEQVEIAKGYLIPKQMKENGLEGKIEVAFSDAVLKFIIENYTFAPGVRKVEEKIESILKKIAKKIVQGENLPEQIALTERDIVKYLGKERDIEKVRETEIGEAVGLAVTGEGRGGILFVQAELIPMGGRSEKLFSHTGNLKQVIEESEKVALSLVRKMMHKKENSEDLLAGNLLHIHIPDGATKKDGPSAGVTVFSALYSLFNEKPVKKDLAMTGEIDLKGNVLPVGGIKEKLLAAAFAGAKEIILPKKNRNDYDEIDDEIKKEVEVHFVGKVNELIKIAFEY